MLCKDLVSPRLTAGYSDDASSWKLDLLFGLLLRQHAFFFALQKIALFLLMLVLPLRFISKPVFAFFRAPLSKPVELFQIFFSLSLALSQRRPSKDQAQGAALMVFLF